MKIHLIRSAEISLDRFRNIAEVLECKGKPIEFIFEGLNDDEADDCDPVSGFIPEMKTWDYLFECCRKFRNESHIPAEEHVVLLTDHWNERNWFSSGDSKNNFFVQTSGWDSFVEADSRYPVAYEIITLPLFILSCRDMDEVLTRVHHTAKGCPFDYCYEKKDVMLRLRTGDICQECREHIKNANVPRNMIRQIFEILEKIRIHMLFRERLELIGPSRLVMDNINRKLVFPDIDNASVKLAHLEMTVYHFFLNHPEGVTYRRMRNHRREIFDIYRNFSDSDNISVLNSRVDSIISSDDNTLSELVSKINRKLTLNIDSSIAELYKIKSDGRGGPHGIQIDRSLVSSAY